MKVKEFLVERLEQVTSMFDHVSFFYGYDVISNFHIVKVKKEESVLFDDVKFLEEEYRLWQDFWEKYPDEELLISDSIDFDDYSDVIFKNTDLKFRQIENNGSSMLNGFENYVLGMGDFSSVEIGNFLAA